MAEKTINVNGGTTVVDADATGMLSMLSGTGGYIVISGGYHYISAKGSMIDVLDANGTATMTGGVQAELHRQHNPLWRRGDGRGPGGNCRDDGIQIPERRELHVQVKASSAFFRLTACKKITLQCKVIFL